MLVGGVIAKTAMLARDGLAALSLLPEVGWLDGRPFWWQLAAYLVVSDFLQWCVRPSAGVHWLSPRHRDAARPAAAAGLPTDTTSMKAILPSCLARFRRLGPDDRRLR